MSVQVIYKDKIDSKKLANYVLFVEENFNINNIKKNVSDTEIFYIKEILKKKNLKKNILSFDLNFKKKIILIAVKKNLDSSEVENLGAEFYNFIKSNNINELSINSDSLDTKHDNDFVFFRCDMEQKNGIWKSTGKGAVDTVGVKNTDIDISAALGRYIEERGINGYMLDMWNNSEYKAVTTGFNLEHIHPLVQVWDPSSTGSADEFRKYISPPNDRAKLAIITSTYMESDNGAVSLEIVRKIVGNLASGFFLFFLFGSGTLPDRAIAPSWGRGCDPAYPHQCIRGSKSRT